MVDEADEETSGKIGDLDLLTGPKLTNNIRMGEFRR